MRAQCSVTFEYEVRPPDTWRGPVSATEAHTITMRAVKLAAKKLRPRNWTSMNCVILERTGVQQEIESITETTTPEPQESSGKVGPKLASGKADAPVRPAPRSADRGRSKRPKGSPRKRS